MTQNICDLFRIGTIASTTKASEALKRAGIVQDELLQRHRKGDWGDVCLDQAECNEEAVNDGYAIFSCYKLPRTGEEIWVFTESTRLLTTFLVSEEC